MPRQKIAIPITRGVASPVDTYVRPGVTDAEQLAQALAQVQPSVGRFSQALSESYIEEQQKKGEQAARIHSEKALKAGDLTRMGELPMQDNPYFMSGYKEEWGRVAAGVWESDFKATMEKDPKLQDSTDLADFDKAVGSHLNEWFKDKKIDRDLDFERGFGHMKDQYVAMARLGFAEGIEKKLDVKSDEQAFAMFKRAITDNWGRASPDAIAKDFETITKNAVLRGRPDIKLRLQAASAIQAAALEAGPEKGLKMLDLLEKVSGENGVGKLKDQSFGSKALEQTRKELIIDGQQEAERMRLEKARAKQDYNEKIASGAVKLLADNSSANLARYLKDFPDADADLVGKLHALQQQWQGIETPSNQRLFEDLTYRILDTGDEGQSQPVTANEIVTAGRHRQLNREDTLSLVRLLDETEASKGRQHKDPLDALAEDDLKDARSRITQSFTDPVRGIVPYEAAGRVQFAQAQLRHSWNVYKEQLKANGEKPDITKISQFIIDNTESAIGSGKSKLANALTIDPPKVPVLNDPLQQVPEAKELPKDKILTDEQIDQYNHGVTASVIAVARSKGVPLSRLREFVLDQINKSFESTDAGTSAGSGK